MSSIRYEFIMSQVKLIRDIKETEKVKISLIFYEGCQGTCILKVCKGRNLTEVYQSLMGVRHSNLAIVYDCVYENGNTYVIEEYIQGKTIAEILAVQGTFSEEETIRIMKEVCKGLEVLHQQVPSIIHNDIKAANIMLREDGSVKLFDFDISRVYKEDSCKNTRLMGTYEYAAPEHYGFGQSEPCTDIYSLGVTMHEMLTGTGLDHEHQVTYEGKLADVIRKCVEIDRKKRYASAMLLKIDLDKVAKNTRPIRNVIIGIVSGVFLLIVGAVVFSSALGRFEEKLDVPKVDVDVSETVSEEMADTEAIIETEIVESEKNEPTEVVVDSEMAGNTSDTLQIGVEVVYPIQGEFLAMEAWNDGTFIHMEELSGTYYLRSSDGKEKQLEGVRVAYGAYLECNPYTDQMYLIVCDYTEQYVYTVTRDLELEISTKNAASETSEMFVTFFSDGTMAYNTIIIKDKTYTFESYVAGGDLEFIFKEIDKDGNIVNVFPLKEEGIAFKDFQNPRAVYCDSQAVYFVGIKDEKNYLYRFDGQNLKPLKCYNDDPNFIIFGYEELCVTETAVRCYSYPHRAIVEVKIE